MNSNQTPPALLNHAAPPPSLADATGRGADGVVVETTAPTAPLPFPPMPAGPSPDHAATAVIAGGGIGAGPLTASNPVCATAEASAPAIAVDGAGQPVFTFTVPINVEPHFSRGGADVMSMDALLNHTDEEGFTLVRSKKRARLDLANNGSNSMDTSTALRGGLALGSPLTGIPAGKAVAGRKPDRAMAATAPLPGRIRGLRKDGVIHHPGLAASLRMSPLEEGQILETHPFGMTLDFSTLDGADVAMTPATYSPPPALSSAIPSATAALPRTLAMSDAGRASAVTAPPLAAGLPARNATPGPSGADRAEAVDARPPLQDITHADGQENLPPLPGAIRDMPPLLRLQTIEFLSHLPERARDNLIGALEFGVVAAPTTVADTMANFWPVAVTWLRRNPWLWSGNELDFLLPANGHGGEDHAMEDAVEAPELGDLLDMDNVAQLPDPMAADAGAPAPLDIQNLMVLPNCVPTGGRQLNRPFPLPRAHVRGAAQIQPPLEITQTPEPQEGFPRIRHGDPETKFAGWEVERIRHVSFLDPATTVVATLHAPVLINAGEGWALVRMVEDFIISVCGPIDMFVVPVDVQIPAPRYNIDDVSTWPPFSFPIWNLPEWAVRAFVAQQTFSTKALTIHFFPTVLYFDDLLGRIEGFTKNDLIAITAFIKSRFESEEVRTILRKYLVRNPHRNVDPLDVAVQKIIDSLRVEIETLPPSNQPNALVYVDTPADSIDATRAFRKDMKTVSWKSLDYGTGVLIYLPPCRGCSSVAHRTDACPLPDVTGWLGPTHVDVARRMGGRGRGAPGGAARGRGRATFRG